MNRFSLVLLLTTLYACGGGGGGSTLDAEVQSVNQPEVVEECAPDCFLKTSDVNQVLAQAVAEASARGSEATIAVVDRVGNVLAVYQMTGADNFVTITSTFEVGDTVTADTVVCIVEAMKVMNEIKAEMSGVITEILVEDGSPVECGQARFRVRPA